MPSIFDYSENIPENKQTVSKKSFPSIFSIDDEYVEKPGKIESISSAAAKGLFKGARQSTINLYQKARKISNPATLLS